MKIGFFLFEDEKFQGTNWHSLKAMTLLLKKKGHDFSCGFLVLLII